VTYTKIHEVFSIVSAKAAFLRLPSCYLRMILLLRVAVPLKSIPTMTFIERFAFPTLLMQRGNIPSLSFTASVILSIVMIIPTIATSKSHVQQKWVIIMLLQHLASKYKINSECHVRFCPHHTQEVE